MRRQRVFIWTGGQSGSGEGCRSLADALPVLPAPAPLHRAARIAYQWGDAQFEILATACSLRTTLWGSESITWLHCKAMRTAEIHPDGPTDLMPILIPARYVTAVEPGPAFRIVRSRESEDLGVFPPNQPPPASALPLPEVDRALTELLAPERN
jgi:hypothetical protein